MNEPSAKNVTLSGSTSIAVGASATVITDPIMLGGVNDFALEYQANCTGAPDVKIELLQSSDGVNYYVPDLVADVITSLTDKDYHGRLISPICVTFVKFRITEQTGIVTDTVMTMKLSVQAKSNF